MAQLDVREFTMYLLHNFTPQTADFQDVGLVNGGDFFSSEPGEGEGFARDALHFVPVVDHGIHSRLVARMTGNPARLSKIQPAG